MATSLYDRIYEKLNEPVKIYLSKDVKTMLEDDCHNFDIKNRNKFYNLLIINYIDDYTSKLEKTGKTILSRMNDLILGGNKEDFPVIARKMAFESNSIKDDNDKEEFISVRVNSDNIPVVAEAIANVTDEVKVSVFFRNLFLNYLSLPAYRREQIIFNKQYEMILKAIEDKRQVSYRNKNKKKSTVFNIYSLEQSATEFHNYLVGSFDGDNTGASSIKLLNIESVRILDEKNVYSDNFKECYEAMKLNGFQFFINELQHHKVYLTDEEFTIYNNRYLDRPVYIDHGEDEGGKYYIFNSSKFQLEGYFSPFKNNIRIYDYDKESQ